MKRYYLCPIVGSGRLGDPYRAKVQDYGLNHVAIIVSDPATGVPVVPWALVLAAGIDHAGAASDAAIDAMPDLSLDSTLSTLNNNQRNRLYQVLDKYGIPRADFNTQTTFREVLTRVGQYLDVSFSLNNFDVGE